MISAAMNPKLFLCLLTAILLVYISSAEAQQPEKVPRIAFLGVSSYEAAVVDAFRQGLHEFGYIEGKNIVVEYRWAEGKNDRLTDIASELVRLNVDVMITQSDATTRAAKQLTSTIPIIFVSVGDGVATGLVASLSRPGGNITGISNLSPELSGKRLELLKETFPKVSRVAVIWNPSNPGNSIVLKETQAASQSVKLKLQPLEVRSLKDFAEAFGSATKGEAQALLVLPDPFVNSHNKRISDYAAQNRLPTIYQRLQAAEDGGLMAYGPSQTDLYRRVAYYIDKILKGAKPSDLPVETGSKICVGDQSQNSQAAWSDDSTQRAGEGG
jgi:putative ABC transport system substrate-binding protein